jgi:hypothetical protein
MSNIIFVLSNGRSGTYYLSQLFRFNAGRCTVVHEPLWQIGNPTFFGPAIHAATNGQLPELRRLMQRKRRFIDRLEQDCYVETSHAFLKSAYLVAHEYFADLKFVRLIRDPMKVAKSQLLREALARRWHMPMLCYKGPDGVAYQRWALTGLEPIFQDLRGFPLTRLQWFVVEWIAIENRAQTYLEQYGAKFSCVTLLTPEDLRDADRIEVMFRELGVAQARTPLAWPTKTNHNWGTPTVIDAADVAAAHAVVAALPEKYKTIFAEAPYRDMPAVRSLFDKTKV